jgi:hypothetical protein
VLIFGQSFLADLFNKGEIFYLLGLFACVLAENPSVFVFYVKKMLQTVLLLHVFGLFVLAPLNLVLVVFLNEVRFDAGVRVFFRTF